MSDATYTPDPSDQPLLGVMALRSIVGSGLGLFMGTGVLLLFTFGIFIKPIEQATGWDRATISLATIPAAIMLGLLGPAVGMLVDRYGPRRVLIAAAPFQLAGMLALAYLSHTAAAFVGLFMLASILGCVQTPVPFSYVVVGWFKRHRGLAMGLTFAFAGLGIASLPPIAARLIEQFGWRHAYAALGAIAILIALAAAIWLLRDPPSSEQREAGVLEGMTLREAMRMPMFWILVVGFLLNAIVATAGSITLPTILSDRGVAPTTAAFAMSFVGLALIAGRLGAGFLLDRYPAIPVATILFLAPVFGHFLMLGSTAPMAAVAAAIFFGLSTGAEGDAMSYILSRAFGLKDYGKIFGVNFFGYAAGTGIGPALMHQLRSDDGSYVQSLVTMGIAGVAAVVLMALLWRRSLPY